MRKIDFIAVFFCFLTIIVASDDAKPDCLEKEKALTLLETAEDLLSKAEDSFPSCREDLNSTDECVGKKPLAYIEISKKMISDVRKHFPKCPKVIKKNYKYSDCLQVLRHGSKGNGIYTIWPTESNTTEKALQVYCDMETDGGGWTVIQRRGKFAVQQDFYQDWETYAKGFGNISEEFWLGNENIRILCHKGCELRFDLQDKNGVKGYAAYTYFYLSPTTYTLEIRNYTGNVGDGMKFHSGKEFSTKDKGPNTAMANDRKGGWWYNPNDYCNPNGLYEPGKSTNKNVYWVSWRNSVDNLAHIEIKVRPR